MVTLGIIGVVATMTISSVVNNFKDMEYASLLKKAYSTLSNATTLVKNDNGGTIEGLWPDISSLYSGSNSFTTIYSQYIRTERICSSNPYPEQSAQCWHKNGTTYNEDGTKYTTSWCFGCPVLEATTGFWILISSAPSADCSYTHITIQQPYCAPFIIDTNGIKPPNRRNYDIHSLYITKDSIIYPKTGRIYDLMKK